MSCARRWRWLATVSRSSIARRSALPLHDLRANQQAAKDFSELRMILGVPVDELLLLALAIIVGGVVTGILAGLFGIGGGALIVPVLYEVFRVLDVPEEVRF